MRSRRRSGFPNTSHRVDSPVDGGADRVGHQTNSRQSKPHRASLMWGPGMVLGRPAPGETVDMQACLVNSDKGLSRFGYSEATLWPW